MHCLHRAGAILAIVLVGTGTVQAEAKAPLTLDAVLALARERSPAILAARARVDEARARLSGASVRMRGNPLLEGAVGSRDDDGESFTELELGLTQGLGVAGRRKARMAGAEAGVAGEIAISQDIERTQLLEAAGTFFRVLQAKERLALWRTAYDIATGILQTAERRFQAGDVAVLDVNVARAARARARSLVLAGEAEIEKAVGDLEILTGVKPLDPASIAGDLGAPSGYDLPQLIERGGQRPDLLALASQIQQAEAEMRLGNTFRRPEFDVGLRYEEEENAKIMLGVVAVSLPVFDRGQALAGEASSRASRLRLEHEALRQAIETEVETDFGIHQRRLEAAEAIGLVLPDLAESEQLAARSYEAGQMSLPDLLVVRRDLLETRLLHVDRLFEASVSRAQLESSAGVLR
jgi:cobalt-zinc-cadmium efflux system outer membrane protein